LLKLIKRLN